MAPFTSWLPVRPNQDFDLVVKIVGNGSSYLIQELAAMGRSVTDRGLYIMAQAGRLNGGSGAPTLCLRIASLPFHSIGHGVDILVYLGDEMPDFRQFGLQRGSVVVWEPPEKHLVQPIFPEGVIVYPVPLRELAAQSSEQLTGRGLIAIGILLQLFGVPEESLPTYVASVSGLRSLKAGFQFAHRVLVKRDIYSLPPAAPGLRRIMLNSHQAVMLGFAVSHCGCGTECDEELRRSPVEWITRHVTVADGIVSLLHKESGPDVYACRGPRGNVVALLRANDSTMWACIIGHPIPMVYVAADIPDVLRLVIEGHRLINLNKASVVGVLIDEELAARHQSVDVEDLAAIIRGRKPISFGHAGDSQFRRTRAAVQSDGIYGATVGYVAWGTAQGVVRDAAALCRSFGLNVAVLYPKIVLPFPTDEIESFARTVTRVVVVESSQGTGFADRVSSSCSFEPALVRPEPGTSLTPMDIFLREGLGAY